MAVIFAALAVVATVGWLHLLAPRSVGGRELADILVERVPT